MDKIFTRFVILFCAILFINAQLKGQTATITIDSNIKHQKITGFGGFVNGPQFQYNWMTTAQIRQLWGANSEMGYNIMRLYIPIGESNWAQVVPTAQLAQSLGIKIFASPWSMPAAWKTNNSINGFVTVDGVQQLGYLRVEHYEDYANYLNNFVVFMRNNGVELDYISIQNEPDFNASYAGCHWTPEQMATFIRDFGHIISAPIMAAEGVGITDNFANAFLPDEVFNNLGIFAGHQYGPIQQDHRKLQAKGMEVWMTEYLINWNANQPTNRNFIWAIDAFDFARAINVAMLSDVNAWIHYASRRFYGMMGDGLHGTVNGAITKRGYILSHFAKYTTGTTRIHNAWKDATNTLDGSAYLSVTGDSIIVKVINPSNNAYALTVDLPFLTDWGTGIATTINANMVESLINLNQETFRPRVNIAASSFTTLIFRKSGQRPLSHMTGQPVYYNPIENQTVTNPAFGTRYQLSRTTSIFDNSRPLISGFTNAGNGYLQLNDRFNKLVFHIDSISSPASFNSANTTLHYINRNGQVRSHNYGTVSFNPIGSSIWVLDISPSVLTDGITGIIGITNGNWTSVLTITFGDVYFMKGDEKMFKFSGPYSPWDSNLLDCLEDPAFTTIDFTETTGINSDIDWNAIAANPNCIFIVGDNVANDNPNVIRNGLCSKLVLRDFGNFYIPATFNAMRASYTRNFTGFGLLVLPFEALIPSENVRVYNLHYASNQVNGTIILDGFIPANTPVLVVGTGTFTFTGSGEVSTPPFLTAGNMDGVYVTVRAPANSYALQTVGGVTSFHRVVQGSEPFIMPFSAYLDLGSSVTAQNLPIVLDDVTSINPIVIDGSPNDGNGLLFDLLGRPVLNPQRGVIYIQNGRKVIFMSN